MIKTDKNLCWQLSRTSSVIVLNPYEPRPMSSYRKMMEHIKQTKGTTYNMFLQLFLKYNPSLWNICNVTYIWHWECMIHFSCYIYVTLGVCFSIEKIYIIYMFFFLLNTFFHFFLLSTTSKWLLFWEDKTKTFFRSNTVVAFYLLCHNIFKNHITVTITLYNNSFVTYQNSTFSDIWFNQKYIFRFLDCFVFFTTRKCANWIK